MRAALLAALLGLGGALAAPQYAGTWTLRALGDDGTVVTQTVTVRQSLRGRQTMLSGGGFSVPVVGGAVSLRRVERDQDATRTYSGSLRLSGRRASGSASVREVYPRGRVVVTRYAVTGRR